MIDDLDTRLRDLAPGVRPRDEFRQNLRMVLRSQAPTATASTRPHSRPRRHRVLALVAAMFVLTLVVGEGGQQLGSYDFELVPVETETGSYRLNSELGDVGLSSSNELDAEKYEEAFALRAAGIERIVEAGGWTVGEVTFFTVTYGYDVDGELVKATRLPTDAPNRMSKEMMAYIGSHENFSYAAIAEGRATELSAEVVVIDGVPITMRKWHVVAPDGSEAIYWEGFPE